MRRPPPFSRNELRVLREALEAYNRGIEFWPALQASARHLADRGFLTVARLIGPSGSVGFRITPLQYRRAMELIDAFEDEHRSHEDHIAWAKGRALVQLLAHGWPDIAAAGFAHDLALHPETSARAGKAAIALAAVIWQDRDPEKQAERVRLYLAGFE